MSKTKLVVRYIGTSGGNATHMNHIFINEQYDEYHWYTSSEKFDYQDINKVFEIEAHCNLTLSSENSYAGVNYYDLKNVKKGEKKCS